MRPLRGTKVRNSKSYHIAGFAVFCIFCTGFSLVIIAALALLVGLLILAVGIVCLKRSAAAVNLHFAFHLLKALV